MKPEKAPFVVDDSTVGGRIAWLHRKIWGGSQSRMAEDTGLSQSAISNVVSGRRAPGRKILAIVGAHPLVNGAWLLTGEGEPLVVEEQPGQGGRFFCPTAAEPLLTSPRDCRQQLTGQYRPVTAVEFDDDRYWLGVDGDGFIDKGVFPGDWLLMDAGGGWLERPEIIVGQPCVVQIGSRKAPTYDIRWLQYDAGAKPTGKYVIDMLAMADDEPLPPGENRKPRGIRLSGTTRPSTPSTTRIALKNVVAVAVKLERPWA